ncbi:MAG: ElyC/SanA/YdcF family protein [Eubacteriales bacterium]|jgi:SanA protein|nr:ElyC/SanA/YdcF family protein [Eubacteriales bacterium]
MKKLRKICLSVFIVVLAVLAGSCLFVMGSTRGKIVAGVTSDTISFTEAQQQALAAEKADCILVLGAAVKPDGTPSAMLEDRLAVGVALYKDGAADKLLLSGDNGSVEYNEVKAMKNYALAHGVAAKDIYLDHAGFSTYESMYRAQAIFGVERVIIVTQTYHEYRAIYDAQRLGMQAAGVSADQQRYSGQTGRDLREVMARIKDFFKCIAKPLPTYLGEKIPIDGDGRQTW